MTKTDKEFVRALVADGYSFIKSGTMPKFIDEKYVSRLREELLSMPPNEQLETLGLSPIALYEKLFQLLNATKRVISLDTGAQVTVPDYKTQIDALKIAADVTSLKEKITVSEAVASKCNNLRIIIDKRNGIAQQQ